MNQQQIQDRKNKGIKKLQQIANVKTPANKDSATNSFVGGIVGVSGQTVSNYRNGDVGDGYILDALIEEFSKLPKPKKLKDDML